MGTYFEEEDERSQRGDEMTEWRNVCGGNGTGMEG